MTGRAKRILIVDDVAENLERLEAQLAGAGYDSVAARDGLGALRLLRNDHVDAIVSELRMPGMDGYEFCRTCKSDPKLRPIPFIFYTATNSDDSDRALTFGMGAEAFLTKPTETRQFFSVLDAAMAKRSTASEPVPGNVTMPEFDDHLRHDERMVTQLSRKIREQLLLVAAIDQTEDGVAILAPGGGLQYANRAMQRLFGVAKEGSCTADVFHDAEGRFVSPAHEAEWNAIRSRSRWFGRIRRRTAGGALVDCQESVTPVEVDSGDLVSFLLVSRDITEQLKQEARAQVADRMSAVGTLAGGIAHDLNNVLAGIVGLAELTAQDITDLPEAGENVRRILETCERAKEIIEQVLAFSRRKEHRLEPVHLRPLLSEQLRLFAATLPTRIRLESRYLTEQDTVLADASQLHRALLNLLGNARQAIGEGSGVITVTVAQEYLGSAAVSSPQGLNPGTYLRLSVADTGCGIEPEALPHIFEPYFTTQRGTLNKGMGLALVHSIVTAHGGGVRVSSVPGEGTTFEVLLGLQQQAQNHATPEAASNNPARRIERVLVVDDEHLVLDVLQRTLRGLGYSVVPATGLTEAVAVFERESGRFDLVLTDKQMPDGNGFDVVRALRSVRPELPAVLCSGYLEEPDLHRARREGIDEILSKPVKRSQLAECLRAVLARRATPPDSCLSSH